MKYIVIVGGVVSGVGKGLTASSTGFILRNFGYKVTFIKIDPYLNVDAGTLTPYDHGEVFVLSDGGEVDLDFGNYERFAEIELTRNHSLTTGKMYLEVISNERRGDFLGNTVQVHPHLTSYVENKIIEVAQIPIKYFDSVQSGSNSIPEICIIELGGTVTDAESLVFVNALKRLRSSIPKKDIIFISVEYIPVLENNEQKTKPCQNSINNMFSFGIKPDIVVTRCIQSLNDNSRHKLAVACDFPELQIFNMKSIDNVFEIPEYLYKQCYFDTLKALLQLEPVRTELDMQQYSYLFSPNTRTITVGIVGKYIKNKDCYVSVISALQISGCALHIQVNIKWIDAENPDLTDIDGFIIPGGFGTRGVEGKISAIKLAREKKIPLLGICFGFQLGVIEFCRNVLNIKNATSQEFEEKDCLEVIKFIKEISMQDKNDCSLYGGTMRCGNRKTLLENGIVRDIYGSDTIIERHRHRYEVNPDIVEQIEKGGMHFVGKSCSGQRMHVLELPNHPFFVGVQYHPEFTARAKRPHPLFSGFLENCIKYMDHKK